jgi:hypothetical protein
MKPVLPFVGAGFAILLWACYLALAALRSRQRHLWLNSLLWAVFALGLLVRGYAPHLEIRNHAFYIPTELQSKINIPDTVARQKMMHLISALLTCGAALGMALYYSLYKKGSRLQQMDVSEV